MGNAALPVHAQVRPSTNMICYYLLNCLDQLGIEFVHFSPYTVHFNFGPCGCSNWLFAELIITAIAGLADRTGSSKPAILNWIMQNRPDVSLREYLIRSEFNSPR